jgi:hypothetical protein
MAAVQPEPWLRALITNNTLFHDKRKEEILEEVKIEPADEELRGYKSKCKKNGYQQGDKNNDALQTKRTKKTQKIFEETIR